MHHSYEASPFDFPLTDASSTSSSPPSLLFSPAPSAATSQLTGTSSVASSSCNSPPATHPTIHATQQNSKRERPIPDAGGELQKAPRYKRVRRSEEITCALCGKKVKTDSLARHRKHACIKKETVRCDGCEKEFSRKDSLKRHRNACRGAVKAEGTSEPQESFNFKFPPPLPLLSQPPPTSSLPAGFPPMYFSSGLYRDNTQLGAQLYPSNQQPQMMYSPSPLSQPPLASGLPAGSAPMSFSSGLYPTAQTGVAEHPAPSTSAGAGRAVYRDNAQPRAQPYQFNQQPQMMYSPSPLSQPPPTSGSAPMSFSSGLYPTAQTGVAEHLAPSTSAGAGPGVHRGGAQPGAQPYQFNQQPQMAYSPGPPPGHVPNDFSLPQATQLPGSHGQADIPTTASSQAPPDTAPAHSESLEDLYLAGSFGILPDDGDDAPNQFSGGEITADFWHLA